MTADDRAPDPEDGLTDDPASDAAALARWEAETNAEHHAYLDSPDRAEDAAALDLAHLDPDTIPDAPTKADALRIAVGRARAARMADLGYPDLDGMLNEPEAEYDWLIPELLERGDRTILTGPEGKGKSTLLRQFGLHVAAGIHPFTFEPMPPKRVLYIDLENSRRQTKRKMRLLRHQVGDQLIPGFHITINWPGGVDLRSKEGIADLEAVVDAAGVDLLITGPIYKLAHGDPNTEEHAKPIAEVFDYLRSIHDFALVLEAHTPHAQGQSNKRPERPYGASLWMRWPEFGLHLADGGALTHWRGDRDERTWPEALRRGGDWPWTAVTDARTITFARILDATRDAGKKLSLRELAEALGGGSPNTMRRAIEANKRQFNALLIELGDDPE